MATVQSGDVAIHYEVLNGEGPDPVVLVASAFFASRLSSSDFATALSHHLTCVSFDRRGTCDSDHVGPYTIEQDATDMAAVLDAVGRPAHVFAAADAARAALVMAAGRHPLLRGMVLWGDHPEGWTTSGLASSADVRDAILRMLETDYRSATVQLAETLYDAYPADERARLVEATLEEIPVEAATGRLRGWLAHDGSELPARVDVPVRYIRRETDWWPAQAMTEAAALFPDGATADIEAGAYSEADQFVPELIEVLAGLGSDCAARSTRKSGSAG